MGLEVDGMKKYEMKKYERKKYEMKKYERKKYEMQEAQWVRRIVPVALALLGMISAYASADPYSDAWGPAIGTELPVLEAYDQSGQLRTLANLAGERGLLLFLNRSADW